MFEFINQELADLKKKGLYRELRTIDQDKVHVFCSNDYLGLSKHPKVKAAAIKAIEQYSFGAGSARLISGNTPLHTELEQKLAEYKKREAALVFPTGYMANVGTITALVNEEDTVIIDRLNHASIIDGCKLSKAKLQVYPHKDMVGLKNILERSAKFRRRLIITDAVFSMDGDLAPVKEIVALGQQYNAMTMVDYAHATGIIDIEGEPDIVMGTLSKTLGSQGGFVAGSQELIDYLRNKARGFIFTTALPPSACAAALAALEVIETEPEHLKKLRENIGNLRLNVSVSSSLGNRGVQPQVSTPIIPIIPIIIGDAQKTLDISAKLLERGFFVSGIRPPTVPEGEARLRITLSAEHTKKEIECLAFLLQELIPASAKPTSLGF